MANKTAGAPAVGAGFGATGAEEKKAHSVLLLARSLGIMRLCAGVSPGVELFLGCFGAVYWNDSFP